MDRESGLQAKIRYDGNVVEARTNKDGGRMLFRFSNNDASIAFSGPSIGTCRYSWDATSSSVSFQPVINLRTHDTKRNITSKPSSLNPADTNSLAWDFNNRLDAIDVDGDTNVDVIFEYDALGRRVRTNDIVYILSGQQVVAEYAAGTAATSPTEKYVYASYIDEPVLKDRTGGLHYYHRNQQYSIIALTGSTGSISERYAYDAYGNLTVLDASGSPFPLPNSNFNNGYSYTGRRFDAETGDYYRARYYDASLGRFCARDPIGFVDGYLLYQGYFVPSGTDPTGLREMSDAACCSKCKNKRKGKVSGGMLICCQGEYVPCYFGSTASNQADRIIHKCAVIHEEDHLDDVLPCVTRNIESQCYRPDWIEFSNTKQKQRDR